MRNAEERITSQFQEKLKSAEERITKEFTDKISALNEEVEHLKLLVGDNKSEFIINYCKTINGGMLVSYNQLYEALLHESIINA